MEIKQRTDILTNGDELRKLLIENPDLPLLIFAGDDCNNGDYSYMSCSSCHASIGEFLDCVPEFNDEIYYCDREQFYEDFEDHLSYIKPPFWYGYENEWEDYVENRLSEYDPYWKKCIILYINN